MNAVLQSRRLDRAAFSAVVVAALALTCGLIYREGVNLVAFFEEPLGYRYFYSLRIIFGKEAPFIPQGHVPGLLHHIANVALLRSGFPASNIHGRPEVFLLLAVITGLTALGIALYHALGIFQTTSARALFAAVTLAIFTSHDASALWYLSPDYHIWIAVLALAILPWASRLALAAPDRPVRDAIGLGILAGVAAGIKISCVVYPATLGLLWFIRTTGIRERFIGVALAIPLACSVLAALVWTYYLGQIHLAAYFADLRLFVQSQASGMPGTAQDWASFSGKFLRLPFTHHLWLVPFAAVISLVFAVFNYRSRWLLALIPGAYAVLYFQYIRDYSVTAVETLIFGLFMVALVAVAVRQETPLQRLSKKARPYIYAGSLAITVACIWDISRFVATFIPAYRDIVRANAEIERRVARIPGPVLMFSAANEYRLISIYSSICKGGTDIFDSRWGVSGYVARTFPFFACAVVSGPLDLSRYQAVLFRAVGGLPAAKAHIEKYHSVSLSEFDCEAPNAAVAGNIACLRR
jgi:hypothetical protein